MSDKDSGDSSQNPDANNQDDGPATLKDALSAAFDEADNDDSSSDTSDDKGSKDAELEETDDDGVKAKAKPSEESDSDDDDDQGDGEVSPPEHWADEDKELFKTLPSEARNYLLKREKQYEQGIEKKTKEVKPILEALKPYQQMLSLRGVDPATAVRTWASAQSVLDHNPVQGLQMLIQSYGDDVKEKLKEELGFTSQEADDYVDPEIKELRKQISDLKRQNQQTVTSYQSQVQQETARQVQEFKDAKDDKGNLLHPHFDDVQGTMHALISNGVVSDLDAAYEQAVWSVPEYREKVINEKREEAKKEEAKKREEAAKRAKKTSTGVKGNGSKPPKDSKGKKTLSDDLLDAWKLSERGELNG